MLPTEETLINNLLASIAPELFASMGEKNITPATLIELVVRTLVAVQVIKLEAVPVPRN